MMDTPSWTSLQPCNMHSCKSKPNPLTSKIHKNPKLVFEFLRVLYYFFQLGKSITNGGVHVTSQIIECRILTYFPKWFHMM
jgi:hypothetical protein